MKQLFDRWNAEITSGDYRFDRIETEIKFLEVIEKDDIIAAFESGIIQNCHALIVAVEGNDPNQTMKPDYELDETHLSLGEAFAGFKQVHDIKQFRSENSFFNRAYINTDS